MRRCSLHGRQLDDKGVCPTCRRYEADEATKRVPRLNANSRAALNRAIKSAQGRRKR